MSEEPKLEELDRLITKGKQKGFLTYDEVNDALPSDIVSLDQLDDIMMLFGSMDIEVVDAAKAGRLPSEGASQAPDPEPDDDEPVEPRRIDLTPGPVGRTEDPVRLYLRELGTVDRLLREREKVLDLARKLRAKAGGRKKRKGEPPWKKHEVSAQAKQVKALQTLRTLSLQPSLLDQWGQDLKKLVEKIQVAEREIALWSDGKRPAPAEVDAFLDSLSEDREDGDRDLYQKAAARHPSIKERLVWVAQQKIKRAEETAQTRCDDLKRIVKDIRSGEVK